MDKDKKIKIHNEINEVLNDEQLQFLTDKFHEQCEVEFTLRDEIKQLRIEVEKFRMDARWFAQDVADYGFDNPKAQQVALRWLDAHIELIGRGDRPESEES